MGPVISWSIIGRPKESRLVKGPARVEIRRKPKRVSPFSAFLGRTRRNRSLLYLVLLARQSRNTRRYIRSTRCAKVFMIICVPEGTRYNVVYIEPVTVTRTHTHTHLVNLISLNKRTIKSARLLSPTNIKSGKHRSNKVVPLLAGPPRNFLRSSCNSLKRFD